MTHPHPPVTAWLRDGHGRVIPHSRVAACGGPGDCRQCDRELMWVTFAARRESNGIDRCGGPGICAQCLDDLLRTGIYLTQYANFDPPTGLDDRDDAARYCYYQGHAWPLDRLDNPPARKHVLECERGCGHPGLTVIDPAVPVPDARDGVPLGHSITSHRVHGWCSHCRRREPWEEIAAWRAWARKLLIDPPDGPAGEDM